MAPADLFYEQTRFMKGKQPQRSNGQQQASLRGDLISGHVSLLRPQNKLCVAGVPYFQTDCCDAKMNDDSSTVKNWHASLGKIIMQNLNTLHQFSDEYF
ncbi:hypothetical protein T07_15306 [Trichinella nelsoni]|uniref:Uncharacterized protein n=1 Tax=Trichinella nelsoni TaxID=6336 RepID=A0A0V0S5C0_9BILA|nr:hypothetical protein T07_15306 [Trichinella nelsoni]